MDTAPSSTVPPAPVIEGFDDLYKDVSITDELIQVLRFSEGESGSKSVDELP